MARFDITYGPPVSELMFALFARGNSKEELFIELNVKAPEGHSVTFSGVTVREAKRLDRTWELWRIKGMIKMSPIGPWVHYEAKYSTKARTGWIEHEEERDFDMHGLTAEQAAELWNEGLSMVGHRTLIYEAHFDTLGPDECYDFQKPLRGLPYKEMIRYYPAVVRSEIHRRLAGGARPEGSEPSRLTKRLLSTEQTEADAG